MNTRVILVDDHQLVRRGLRLLLEQHGDIQVVGEAANGAGALEQAKALVPDLVVMDVHLPDISGLEVSRRLLADFPDLKIVVLSGDADMARVNEALQTGVCGYLLKSSAEEELGRAIRAIMEGRLYLCPEINALVIQDYKNSLAAKAATSKPALSGREREVLRLIAQGHQLKEIAVQLKVGVRTAETFRRRLMSKLDLHTTADLTRYAVREGIVEL